MTSIESETFQQLVMKLYQSQLNFHLTETPYSAQIIIRKSFLKDKIGPSPWFSPTSVQNEEVETLHTQVIDLQKTVESSNRMIEILESKLAKAETEALKTLEIKATEISVLKSSLKKSEDVVKSLKKDLDEKHKDVKGKEKAIQRLELKCENLSTNIKNHKAELTKVKNENKKLLKCKAKTEKQLGKDFNQNIPAKDERNLNVTPCSLIGGIAPVSPSNTSSSSNTPPCELLDTATAAAAVEIDHTTAPSACPSSTQPCGPSSPPCNLPLPGPTSVSPRTPPRNEHLTLACGENQFVVENDLLEDKKVKSKNLLSEEVQEILKNDKFDFAKLVEAVRNNKLPSDLSENDANEDDYSSFNYEEYPDEYWNIHDVSDDAIENDVTEED